MTSDEHAVGSLWRLDASQLAAGYRAGTFRPLDVIGDIHGRIDEVNPALNAVIAEDRPGARETARESGERWDAGRPLSPLDGVPVTVKDNIHVAGLPATWGSRAYAHLRPTRDEPAIERLRRAGAVIIGKTNVPEFTVQGYTSNQLFGTTGNPLAPGRTPGGSTGGGAAAVAAGFGPLAIGTDGGGSLRRPAAHCGLFALKPSIGQVARAHGFRQILNDFEVVGPLARSLRDLYAAFVVMRGYDARDARTTVAFAPTRPFPERPRVGFFPRVGAAPVDSQIASVVERFVQSLSDDWADVSVVDAPFDSEETSSIWTTIATAGLAWELTHLGDARSLVGEHARVTAEAGGRVTATAYLDAVAGAASLRGLATELFVRFDLLMCPTTAALAWPAQLPFAERIDGIAVGPRGHAVFTSWINIAGLCAVNVPIATTTDAGGIGVQVIAAAGRDVDLLDSLVGSGRFQSFVTPGFNEGALT